MPRSLLLTTAVLALVIGGCTAQPATDTADTAVVAAADPAAVRSTIEATEQAWSAAYLKGDAAAIAALYSEDAASIPATGDWERGRDAIAKQNQAHFDTVTIATREDIPDEVTVAGNYAIEVGHYAWTGTAKKGGKAMGEKGRYMVLWRKDADGTWRLFRDIGSAETPKKM